MMDFILKMSDFTELVKREAAMTSEQREWRVLHNAGQFLCINDDSSIEKNEDSSTEMKILRLTSDDNRKE